MVKEDILNPKLLHLLEYLDDLKEVRDIDRPSMEEFKNDKKLRRYVQHTLQLAVECCLDIGSHIIAADRLREPDDNKDIFAVLSENGIVPKEELPALKKMAQFRNVIVHDYAKIEPEMIYSIVQRNLSDIEGFLSAIKRNYLKE